MKILEELLDGGSKEMQRKKKNTFYAICITLSLIAVMLIVLLIFSVASLISSNMQKDGDDEQIQFSIGATEAVVLGEDAIYSGTLLKLDGTNLYKGKESPVIIRNSDDRPKTQSGGNVYSILAGRTDEEYDFRATADALKAFNLMLKDFYAAKSDDNLCITNAYSIATKDTAKPIFASGTAFELGYYFDYAADKTDVRDIKGVEKYSWLYSNAYKYGFISIALEGSNSIFRFVGVPHATYMKTKKLDLDTYLEQLREATPDAPILIKVGRTTYASYFVSASGEHLVPAEHEYTVSGNNYDGYVITAKIEPKQANK
ncbi:MAG: D-alanyl-D-alanine carboxypeptidase family protein [Ruminococcaceae bacterium]|nr:D-alanyl-D-alanine carboxypeptidase family protein [Oscillospiraceae bacterium]